MRVVLVAWCWFIVTLALLAMVAGFFGFVFATLFIGSAVIMLYSLTGGDRT